MQTRRAPRHQMMKETLDEKSRDEEECRKGVRCWCECPCSPWWLVGAGVLFLEQPPVARGGGGAIAHCLCMGYLPLTLSH